MSNGMARFAEEAYRGEPQTPKVLGLRLYQWMGIGTVILGAALTTVRSSAAARLFFSRTDAVLAASFAGLTALVMGVDFPESNRLLARLT